MATEADITLITVIVSVIIQLILCIERIFSRVKKSECKKTASGSISISVENTPNGSRQDP